MISLKLYAIFQIWYKAIHPVQVIIVDKIRQGIAFPPLIEIYNASLEEFAM